MATEHRVEKINRLFLEEITRIIKFQMENPDISAWTTVLNVETTPDLSFSRIFISVMGSEKEQLETVRALNHSKSFIKKRLSRTIRLRKFPDLRFHLIGTHGSVQRIHDLLDSITPPPEDGKKSDE